MTWTKLGEEFPDAAADMPSDAFRLHVEALAWSNRRLYDLMVPKRDLRRFTFVPAEQLDEAIVWLIENGWWQDCEAQWFIGIRFPEWQQEREQIEHRRKRNAEAQRRKRYHDIGNHHLCLPPPGGRCRYAPSSVDTPADSAAPSGGDPDRIGTVRNGEGQDLRRREGLNDLSPGPRSVSANDLAMNRLREVGGL